MRRFLPWIVLGGAGLFLASQMGGGAQISVSPDCSTITIRGSEQAVYKLFSEHTSAEMEKIAETLAESGQLPTGLAVFQALFGPFAPEGCGALGADTKVDLGGGQITTLAELAGLWDEQAAGLQGEIDAYLETQEAIEQGADIPDIEIPAIPEFPALPGVTDPVGDEPPPMGPVPGQGEPPAMGGRRPQLNPVSMMFEHAKRSNRGRVGRGYYVQRGVVTPRSSVKALVGARVVRSAADTDAMLRGTRRRG